MLKKLSIFVVISLLFVFFTVSTADAAVLYLNPASGNYLLGEIFIAEVRLDTQGEHINAVQADLSFSSDVLEIQDLSEGDSILSLWIKKPEFSNDKIYFIGGIPGGYQGSNGLIGKIVFKVKKTGENGAQIVFGDTSKTLLNDGRGSIAKLATNGMILNILPEKSENPENQWQKDLAEDKIFPQPFKIEISQNSLIFDGRNFITFSTTDKQTGIDHYEIKEGKKEWKTISSPYVLENQKLMGSISIKAIDKAGNYWIETIKLPEKQIWKQVTYISLIKVENLLCTRF